MFPSRHIGPSFKTRLLVGITTIILTALFMWGYKYWTSPVVPVFPDIENADGTVDYTLVGTEFTDPGWRPIAYNKLVMRLPKSLRVKRPLAEGGSVSGEGVILSYAENPNAGINFHISWQFLVDGNTDLSDPMAEPETEQDKLSLSIYERPEKSLGETVEAFFSYCRLLEPSSDGFVQYVPARADGRHCLTSSFDHARYVLLQNGQPLAFVSCPERVQDPKKQCWARIYRRNYIFTGYLPARFGTEFPSAYPSLISIIDKSIVSQSRIVLE
jgi:hypothetical protein